MRGRLAVLLLVGGLLLAGCSGETGGGHPAGDGPGSFTVTGQLTLTTYRGMNYANTGRKGEHCWGEMGYSDIAGGTPVVIRDASGARVGLGRLDDGMITQRQVACTFDFEVEDVPDEGDLYTVEVGSRGEVTFDRDQAGDVQVTLGD